MGNYIKFILEENIVRNGIVPLLLTIVIILIIIVITIVLVKKEVKGVKKNEKK